MNYDFRYLKDMIGIDIPYSLNDAYSLTKTNRFEEEENHKRAMQLKKHKETCAKNRKKRKSKRKK